MRRRSRTKFERRKRRAARIALYSSLVLIVGALAAIRPQLQQWRGARIHQPWANVDWAGRPEVDLLRRYVQIDTSYTTGSEVDGARFLAAELRRAGLDPHVEILGDRHANVWAILEGEDPRALVLHSHIDTDPLYRPDQWRHPPLSGHIEGPWMYGRGVFDMKSVAIAQLMTMRRLVQSGRPLRRSVIFLATGSEEQGSDLGAKWLIEQHPKLVERFWAVLTEGGVVETEVEGKAKYWGVETAQKHFVDLLFCSPRRERLERLYWDVRDFGRPLDGVRIVPEAAAVFDAYAETRGRRDYRGLLASYRELPFDLGRFEQLPRYLAAMLRDEVETARIDQADDGTYTLRAVLKLLPDTDPEVAREKLLPPWMVQGLDWRQRSADAPARGSSAQHPLFVAIENAVKRRHPGSAVGPFLLVDSATDARHFRRSGIPAYGFSPFLIFATDTLQVGETNERMALHAYSEGVDLYAELVDSVLIDTF